MKHLYIGGCPRSGTTLLASILGSDQETVVTPESQFKELVLESKSTKRAVDSWRLSTWQLSDQTLKELNGIVNYQKFTSKIVQAYAKTDIHSTTWIDHTPSNVMHFEQFKQQIPDAKLVVILRDPRATYSSVAGLDWGAYNSIEFSHLWNRYLSLTMLLLNKYPEDVYIVKYEDLVTNSATSIQALSKFTGLSVDTERQNYTVPEHSLKQHELVGKPIDSSRLYRWVEKLSRDDVTAIESICGRQMQVLGYEVKNAIKPIRFVKRVGIYSRSIKKVVRVKVNKWKRK